MARGVDGGRQRVAYPCAVLVVAAFVFGCSAWQSGEGLLPRYPAALQLYEGEALPAEEVAVVSTVGGSSARHAYAFIRSVDGARVPGIFDGRGEVQLRPGEHTFGLAFGPNGFILGGKDQPDVVSVTFRAAAGHVYRIHGKARLLKGQSTVRPGVVYVVDAATGARVETTM